MAKPPAGSSLLFSAISSDAFIKERKNGSFQMEMMDVESINWFTERPERADGTWKPKKLVKQWDKYFADSEPNAQTTFRVTGIAGEQGFATFEMFKPKITSKNNLKFKVKPINKNGEDSLTDLVGKELDIASLFIDSATPGVPSCFPNCDGADLRGLDMSSQQLVSTFEGADMSPKRGAIDLEPIKTNLSDANLSGAYLIGANLSGANLSDADLAGANLTGANLSLAGLFKADLTGANLSSADLSVAELFDADLSSADLSGADLTHAFLPEADLTNARLNSADLSYANLGRADLFGAKFNSKTIWPTAEYWSNTTCPDGSNSNEPGNETCGFTPG